MLAINAPVHNAVMRSKQREQDGLRDTHHGYPITHDSRGWGMLGRGLRPSRLARWAISATFTSEPSRSNNM
jgi:hypothetical protein